MTARAIPREPSRIGEGWSTFILLAFMLLCVSGSIDAANWADGLSISTWTVLGGLVVGFAMGKLDRVPGWLTHAFALLLGIFAVPVFATSLLPRALTFQEKMLLLDDRFGAWVVKVISGGVSADNLIFVLQVAYLTWLMSYFAAWFIYRRHQVWGAVIPSGIGILLNLFYAAPQTNLYFGGFILCALLLIVRLNLHAMERGWRALSIGYTSDINVDLLTYGTIFAVGLMVLAWMMPATAPGPDWLGVLEPLQSPWQNVEDQFNRVFSSLRAVARPGPSTFFGTTLQMGGPVHLGNRPVMDVKTDYGRYWRGSVYDKYTGLGWINTHVNALNLGANDPRLDDPALGVLRADVTQTFKVYLPDQNILYSESQPIRFDQPTEVRYGEAPGNSATPFLDVALVRTRRIMRDGDSYSVVSSISVADEDSLRTAPTDYSAWIRDNYLQLPDTVPQRVRDLAKSITAPYLNPYDKAVAIQEYLRTHIKYNENVSAPPPGVDGVDYTLFERPEGYCNYYASAMAVLARAAGIPARVASGYTMGDYSNGVYHVVEANAHSWTEVYFPGYGWIEFEPTASKPEIERPKKQTPAPDNSQDQSTDLKSPNKSRTNRGLEDDSGPFGPGTPWWQLRNSFWDNPTNVTLTGAGITILLAAGIVGVMQWRRSRRLQHLPPAARFYENLLYLARWVGVRAEKHATPFERANALSDAVPTAHADVDRATGLYVREKYSAHPLDESERSALTDAWARVRAALVRAWVVRTIQRITTPIVAFVKNLYHTLERMGNPYK